MTTLSKDELITDHPFKPSTCYPEGEGCAHIIRGGQWTTFDPDRCRKSEKEHATTLRGTDQEKRFYES